MPLHPIFCNMVNFKLREYNEWTFNSGLFVGYWLDSTVYVVYGIRPISKYLCYENECLLGIVPS